MTTDQNAHFPFNSHRWTLRFAVSLSAIIALFGTWGWLTHYQLLPTDLALVAGGVLMAGVCLVAQGVCNNMAVEARRAKALGLKWSFRAATAVALGFGAISAMGLEHGWQIAKAVAPDLGVVAPDDWLMTLLFVFIAFGEPASFWIVEAVRSGEARDQVQLGCAADAPAPERGGTRTWSPRSVGKGMGMTKAASKGATSVVAAAALALGGAGPGADISAQPTMLRAANQVTSAVLTDQIDQRARVQALGEAGWSERRIAIELGVTRHAVRRALGRVAA